jgi:hypothetical protein
LDGEQWGLKITFYSGEKKVSSGGNAYPKHWDVFKRTIKIIKKELLDIV